MTSFSARFYSADDCDFALSELKEKMTVHNSRITRIDNSTSGALPVNYPDTPIAGYSSADWLSGKEHILNGSNIINEYNEVSDKTGVRLQFTVADKNKVKADRILLKFKAFDIKSGY